MSFWVFVLIFLFVILTMRVCKLLRFFVDYRFIPHRADRVYALMSSIRVMLLRVTPSAVFGWV
ncbi:hypothetical protein ACQXW2_14665 [Bacillus subtilis]